MTGNFLEAKGLVKLSTLSKNCLQLKSDLKALTDVLIWFDQLYNSVIPREVWLRCQLALAEAFTNGVRHAHKNQSVEVPIEIEVTLTENSIEMRVWDYGSPFDLKEKLKIMPVNHENDSGGGRGLRLLEAISDHLSYTRSSDDRNCLLMIKYYGNEDKGSSQ
ncbi:ATP-binding protein [Aerosakkonemataceae cyanobacterium BLCC-F50]|uniref:ATP-binding protein n=1 Tax=Floridaenema flaviceps BLCC-F50 TaxID=3153642 RepID=A0ABV4XUZ2_9CYAN